MRIVRLAQLFELKYGLQSQAAIVPVSQDRLVADVKRDILDVYRNYFSRSARDSMLQFAADTGEDKAVALTYRVDVLVKNIDKRSPENLIVALNEILELMLQMKSDPEKTTRQAIRDKSRGETDRVIQQRLIKYERIMDMAFPALQKAARKLKIIVPDVEVQEGTISRQKGELTKNRLIYFVLASPPLRDYGITSLDIVQKILDEPEMKAKLTTLYNAVHRGHIPLDGPEVLTFATEVKRRMEEKAQTNVPALESPELPPINPQPEKGEE
jgi:hypothetical protein